MAALSIGVLMASHNRRPQTLESLDSLLCQDAQVVVRVFLVDDGSSDGTAASVAARYENVRVIPGDGSLYWAAAMAKAEDEALASDLILWMWLNDDVVLDHTCLRDMLSIHEANPDAIVVGAVRDPISGELTYGGRRREGIHPQRFSQVPVREDVQECDTFHGNCVLVPRVVAERVGPIDAGFPHAYADDDYGLRARRVGIRILQCPGTSAPALESARSDAVGLLARWRYLQSPKGLPVQAQARYLRRHGGLLWPVWLVVGTTKRLLRH